MAMCPITDCPASISLSPTELCSAACDVVLHDNAGNEVVMRGVHVGLECPHTSALCFIVLHTACNRLIAPCWCTLHAGVLTHWSTAALLGNYIAPRQQLSFCQVRRSSFQLLEPHMAGVLKPLSSPDFGASAVPGLQLPWLW